MWWFKKKADQGLLDEVEDELFALEAIINAKKAASYSELERCKYLLAQQRKLKRQLETQPKGAAQ